MARRSREAYLWDIADSCRAIMDYVQGESFSDYEQSRMMRRAIERELSIVCATVFWRGINKAMPIVISKHP